MPKWLIIILLIIASLAIVGIISYRKIMDTLENASEYAHLKEGVALTEKVKMIAFFHSLSLMIPKSLLTEVSRSSPEVSTLIASSAGFKGAISRWESA